MDKNTFILYKTTCLIDGKTYHGITNGRVPNYLGSGGWRNKYTEKAFKTVCPGKQSIREAIKQHGRKNFTRNTIQTFNTLDEARLAEAVIVTKEYVELDSNYNLTPGGGYPPRTTSTRMNVGADNGMYGRIPHNKGIFNPEAAARFDKVNANPVKCPHCEKVGHKGPMTRHHFDNCKWRKS